MKSVKIIAILFFVALASSSAFSQTKISLGLEAGVNIANTSNTPDANTGSKTGIIAGGILDIGLSPQFSIAPGIRYIMKGNTQTGNFTANGQAFNELKNKGDYLQFPALLRVKFPLTEIKPYLVAGPVLGILMAATTTATNTNTGSSADFDQKSLYETTEFSLLFGGGMDFRVATKTDLFFQVAYELGLTDITKNTATSVKNNGFELTGGVRFGL